jgi:15-cis-phytoene synthase
MNEKLQHDTEKRGADTTDTAASTLRKHGQSFYWAGQLLSATQLEQAAILYALCRKVDDIADEALDAQSKKAADNQLKYLSQALTLSQAPAQPLLLEIYTSAQQLFGHESLAMRALQDLIATIRGDLKLVRIGPHAELLRYCYGAAGTVGVMMACLLKAKPRAQALPHAIDLGIAMQMTNIARDVLEDAHLDRIYLPTGRATDSVSPADIVADHGRARHIAWLAIKELLEQADAYYASGWQGLSTLPLRPRVAIAVAAAVYQEIGHQLLRLGETRYWQQRCVVSKPRKALITLRVLLRLLKTIVPLDHPPGGSHRESLHKGLRTCLDVMQSSTKHRGS